MQLLLEQLSSKQILVFDGAMGTMLLARGMSGVPCLEMLNLESPEIITEISAAFVDAGANVLQANTFGASPLRLRAKGLEHKTIEINQRGVEIARAAAGGKCTVVASCGPSGFQIPEELSADDAYRSYAMQMTGLADAEGILVETMMDLREALIALRAAREILPGKPVLVTMTFERDGRTKAGNSPEETAAALESAGAAAVGANCGSDLQLMIGIARQFVGASRIPVLIQPGAGLPLNKDGAWIYPYSPEMFGVAAKEMLEIGVRMIGGCCGTTPEHIRVLQTTVGAYLRKRRTDELLQNS